MNITVLAVVWFGGNQVIAGQMQVGDLTAFTTYVTQFPHPVEPIIPIISPGFATKFIPSNTFSRLKLLSHRESVLLWKRIKF